MSENLRGRSLYFVSKIKGVTDRFLSAKEAMSYSIVNTTSTPALGSVVWLKGGEYGDCGIYLLNRQVLMLDPDGKPILKDFNDLIVFEYLGWSHTIGTGEL